MIAHAPALAFGIHCSVVKERSRQARTLGANASETRTAGDRLLDVPEHAAGGGGVNRPRPRLAGRWRGEGSSYTWVACLSNRTRTPPRTLSRASTRPRPTCASRPAGDAPPVWHGSAPRRVGHDGRRRPCTAPSARSALPPRGCDVGEPEQAPAGGSGAARRRRPPASAASGNSGISRGGSWSLEDPVEVGLGRSPGARRRGTGRRPCGPAAAWRHAGCSDAGASRRRSRRSRGCGQAVACCEVGGEQRVGDRHELAELLGRRLGDPDVVAERLRHLRAAGEPLEQRRRDHHLRLLALLLLELAADEQVEQLVGAAELDVGVAPSPSPSPGAAGRGTPSPRSAGRPRSAWRSRRARACGRRWCAPSSCSTSSMPIASSHSELRRTSSRAGSGSRILVTCSR